MNNEKWDLISKLDFSTVNKKLRDRKSFWWNWRNNVDKLEAEYRQFLYLAAANPEKVVVPWSEQLDDFWHEHILDTVKYEKDCNAIFGKMFHHNPHLPKGSDEQVKAFADTKAMYKEAFSPKAKEKAKSGSTSSDDPGCGGGFVAVFCSSCCSHSSSDGNSHSDCGHSDSGHSCGGHSCGGSSCSGGSSCGGSSCGGGGCGGGGD